MTTTVNGTEISWEQRGDGPREILLLHGWGADASLMRPVAEKLADCGRFTIPDFPGHGHSGKPPEPWGVPEYAEALTGLLDALQVPACHVIAHSFGARVAAWIAANQPERFRRIILTGAAGIPPKQTEEKKKRAAQYQRIKRIGEAMRKTGVLSPLADGLQKKAREKYGSRDYNALDEEMRQTFVRVVNQDLTPLYSRIPRSVLLIWGTEDTETPLWMGREMERLIPDAGLVELEGGTHFAYLEQLDRFCLIARQFLTEEQA